MLDATTKKIVDSKHTAHDFMDAVPPISGARKMSKKLDSKLYDTKYFLLVGIWFSDQIIGVTKKSKVIILCITGVISLNLVLKIDIIELKLIINIEVIIIAGAKRNIEKLNLGVLKYMTIGSIIILCNNITSWR
jgi:hypothetical protein